MTEKTTVVSRETLADKTKEIVLGPMRTFQHIYAGANTIREQGQKIVFNGPPGGHGTYVTNDPDEIEYLEKLTKSGGSQVTELVQDSEGRNKVLGDTSQTEADIEAAKQDALANTMRDANPAIAAARANIAKVQAQNG